MITKLLAVYVGPSGLAILGQFQDFQRTINGLSTGGLRQGLIKYLSEYKDNIEKSKDVFSTAIKLVILFLLPVSLCLLLFSTFFSELVFHDAKYAIWVKGLGVCVIPASIGALLLATLNGIREIGKLTAVGVLSSLLSVGIAALAIPYWGVMGGAVSFLVTPFLVFVVSLIMLNKSDSFSVDWFKPKVSRDSSAKLGKFIIMAIASAVSIPVSHVIIRNHLTSTISLDAAGIWTGMWNISTAYLMVVTTTLSVYYLPKLSGLKDATSIKKEIRHGQAIILPIVIVSSLVIYFTKGTIILLLFDNKFLLMSQLFAFQLLGDFVKIATFLYGYSMVAKARVKAFVFVELFFSVLFVFLTMLFVDMYGLLGVSIAFAVNYGICFIFVFWWFHRSCTRGIFNES